MSTRIDPSHDASLEAHPSTATFETLLGIVRDALAITPPLYLSSVLGLPWTWVMPHQRYSELRLLDPWRPGRTIQFLSDILVPALPVTPPQSGPALLERVFWRPTVILQRPDHYGAYTSYP